MSEHWNDLLHRAEAYAGLTFTDRLKFTAAPRDAWAWLTNQLEKEGWVWSASSGYSKASASVQGAGNRVFTRQGSTPLSALMAAFVAASEAAREGGHPLPG